MINFAPQIKGGLSKLRVKL